MRGSNDEEYPVILSQQGYLTDPQLMTLRLPIETPSQFAWANRLQVVAWHHSDPHAQEVSVEAELNTLFPLHQPHIDITLRHPSSSPHWSLLDHYYLQIRFVDWQTPGMVRASPCYLFGFAAMPGSGAGDTDFEDVMNYYLRTICTRAGSETRVNGDNRHIGGLKKRDLQPPFPFDQVPDPNPGN